MPYQYNRNTENFQRGFNQPKQEGPMPFGVLVRKFFREVQQSRILSEAKKRRFYTKDISRQEKRKIARRKAWVRKLKRGY